MSQQYGINFSEFSECNWYAVMNMIYNDDYSLLPHFDDKTYIMLSKAWLMDGDIKAYEYHKMLKKHH